MWKLVLKRMAADVWEWVLLPAGVLVLATPLVVSVLAVPGHLMGVFTAPWPVLGVGAAAWMTVAGIGLWAWIDHTRDTIRKERK